MARDYAAEYARRAAIARGLTNPQTGRPFTGKAELDTARRLGRPVPGDVTRRPERRIVKDTPTGKVIIPPEQFKGGKLGGAGAWSAIYRELQGLPRDHRVVVSGTIHSRSGPRPRSFTMTAGELLDRIKEKAEEDEPPDVVPRVHVAAAVTDILLEDIAADYPVGSWAGATVTKVQVRIRPRGLAVAA